MVGLHLILKVIKVLSIREKGFLRVAIFLPVCFC